ncbi:tetratricopeptide repeat protein [Erythrobacter insulae]|uniref:Tetratricopeptide repeat protein n=1 Tax=Erythrobacter insulae TaxID=2584124 RepID=A0A547PCE2_9SPHN|nr:tetratricopeptide repeat protein [Erythrobacter insulae]TRD11801.1 tetratricopeptide repeat protein [Erythrobacter insulae]
MKMTHITLAGIASLALLTGCGLAPEEKLAEAEASYDAHDYSGAKVYAVSALKDLPGDTEALTLLARAQIAMGDGEGAMLSLSQIAKANQPAEYTMLVAEAELLRGEFNAVLETVAKPKTADAARLSALAHLGLNDLDAAKRAIASGETLPGERSGLLAVKAQIQLLEGNVAAAQGTASQALAQGPDNIDALLVSARVNQALFDLPATLGAYERAVKLYPQNFPAQLGRAATLGEMGQLEAAKEAASQLAQSAPDSIDVIHLKARIALEENKWQTARELLQPHEAALRQDPSKQATYATALLRVGQVAQARIWLEPLVEDYPFLRKPRALLAEAELAAGEPKAALATIRSLAERPDAKPEELAIAANAASAAGDSSAARFAAREKSTTPEWFGGELAKADSALRNQQWRKAIGSYEAINARIAEPNAMVLNNLAYAKSKLGENKDAVRIALQAVDIAPDHPAILDTAGWILFETGEDRTRGLRMLEKAARLDPDNTAIARRLAAAKRG